MAGVTSEIESVRTFEIDVAQSLKDNLHCGQLVGDQMSRFITAIAPMVDGTLEVTFRYRPAPSKP